MSFLFPAFLFGTLAVALPIILHLLARQRAPRHDFGAVRFLAAAAVRDDRRRRLREWLLLALRVTALLLLAGAFARPVLQAGATGETTTVLVVDRSLSMSAPGQMAAVRQRARDTVMGADASTPFAVVAFDDDGEVVLPPTTRRLAILAALDGIEATVDSTRYAAGLTAAASALDGNAGRIVVVSDAQRVGWDDDPRIALPADTTVDIQVVAPVSRNLAVTALRADDSSATATLLNTSRAAVEATVTVSVDGQPVSEAAETLGPGTTDRTWALPSGELVAVAVDDEAGYRGDDMRRARVAFGQTDVLLLASSDAERDGAWYLERALGIETRDGPFSVRTAQPGDAWATDLVSDAGPAVAVLTSTRGLRRGDARRLADFVRAGGGLWVVLGPAVDLVGADLDGLVPQEWRSGLPAEPLDTARRLIVTDRRHPIFRRFGEATAALRDVRFDQVIEMPSLTPPAGNTLARFVPGGDALIEIDVTPGRLLVFASDLDHVWNGFPRHPTFVPFVHEVLRYLAGSRGTEPGVVNPDPRESMPAADPAERFLERAAAARTVARPSTDGSMPPSSAPSDELWWYAAVALGLVLMVEAWVGRTMA